ncbi:MAG: hypothetical protein RJA44_1942, partial [Pseudomonadota bacterium]
MQAIELQLRRFTIRFRMNGAIVMVLGLFFLLGVTGLVGGGYLKSLNTHFMTHSVAETRAFGHITTAVADVRRLEGDMVIQAGRPEAVRKLQAEWKQAIEALRKALQEMLLGEEDDDNPLVREALGELDQYVAQSSQVQQQILADVYDTPQVALRMLERAREHIAKVDKLTDQIAVILEREAKDTQADFDLAMNETLWAYIAVLTLVIVLVVPLTLINSRSIVHPIEQGRRIAEAIAQGDLTHRMAVEGQDESAQLQRALMQMQDSLQRMVGSVRQTTDQIQVASNEVAAGNQDLSG